MGLVKVQAQIIDIKGSVRAEGDRSGIYVMNISSYYYTVTDQDGEFVIKADLNDTLEFSALQYKTLRVPVNEEVYSKKYMEVDLENFVEELGEVHVGLALTGDLGIDSKRLDYKQSMSPQDVGIPTYQGPELTQNERRLHAATSGFGVHALINAISGRTKELKRRVVLEKERDLLEGLKSTYSRLLFSSDSLSVDRQNEFFLFCMDDPDFVERYRSNTSDLGILALLKKKLKDFIKRMESDDE